MGKNYLDKRITPFKYAVLPILMLAASNDTVVSTPAIEEFAYHLRGGSHLVIAGSKHEILQEQDRFRAQFWAAFDAFVPGTPLFK